MSLVAICIVLGVLVALMIKAKAIRAWGALLCIAFGVTLAASPMGQYLSAALHAVGSWAMTQLRAV